MPAKSATTRRKLARPRTDRRAEVFVRDADLTRYDPATKAGVSNLLVIHSTLSGSSLPDLESRFAGQGYGALKGEVADVVLAAVEPFQTRMAELLDDPAELDRIVAAGAERATVVARATMQRVREAVGLLPARPAGA